MIAQFLNRSVVLQQLSELRESLELDRKERSHTSPPTEEEALLAELIAAEARERDLAADPPAEDPIEEDDRRGDRLPAPIQDFAYVSREPIIGLLQSALDEQFEQPEHRDDVVTDGGTDDRRDDDLPIVTDERLANLAPSRHEDGRRAFEKFSLTDPLWVRAKLAEGVRLFRGRHPFNVTPARPSELPDHARLVVVGDWGSGLPRARAVAKEMRKAIDHALREGRRVHVVHLGDVYYSGWPHEYKKRFLPWWPVRPDEGEGVGSWTLNANHDMYSGGYGYYDVALTDSRFAPWQSDGHAPSSFFSFVGKHWRILGIDTGWDEGGLKDPQARWLEDELKAAAVANEKTMLLSHHQLFSAYETAPSLLSQIVEPVLARHPVTAWLWGHEHRCMLFQPYANVRFGRCIGDGGIPVHQWHKESAGYPVPGVYENRRYFQHGLERWAVMGFATLDFDGPVIDVRYVDETGYEHRREKIE
jgi:calcineurin-like phosphoesterase family protein